MKNTKSLAIALACGALISALSGCQATGEQYEASTYQAAQVNSRQEVKTVEIVAVLPAKVEVDNTQGKQAAMVGGAILGALAGGAAANTATHGGKVVKQQNTVLGAAGGAAAGAGLGSMVSDKTLVDGVQLTYKDDGKVYNSAQVGKLCQFKPGVAELVATTATETRVQPNAECPTQNASK